MNFATRTTTNMARATCAELTLEKNAPSLLRRAGLGVPSRSVRVNRPGGLRCGTRRQSPGGGSHLPLPDED